MIVRHEWAEGEIDYFCRWYPVLPMENLILRMHFIFGNLKPAPYLYHRASWWGVKKYR